MNVRKLVAATVALASLAASVAAAERPPIDPVAREGFAWESLHRQDWPAFDACFATEYRGVYADGRRNRKEELDGAHQARLQSYEIKDAHVTRISSGLVIVDYTISEVGTAGGQDFTGTYQASSTWMHVKGNWQVVLHTEAKVP